MHKPPAPGVTLLTEITQHKCRGKVVFPRLCVPALQPEVMAAWAGTSPPELSLVLSLQSSLKAKTQNSLKEGGDYSGNCPELRSKLSPLHSYPRKLNTRANLGSSASRPPSATQAQPKRLQTCGQVSRARFMVH